MTNLFGSICLSDIPKELIRTGKNGKKYLSVTVAERRSPSAYGDTHYIKAYAKKGTIDARVNLYIGELKPSTYATTTAEGAATLAQPQQPQQPMAPDVYLVEGDELPF